MNVIVRAFATLVDEGVQDQALSPQNESPATSSRVQSASPAIGLEHGRPTLGLVYCGAFLVFRGFAHYYYQDDHLLLNQLH